MAVVVLCEFDEVCFVSRFFVSTLRLFQSTVKIGGKSFLLHVMVISILTVWVIIIINDDKT